MSTPTTPAPGAAVDIHAATPLSGGGPFRHNSQFSAAFYDGHVGSMNTVDTALNFRD